MKYKVVLFDLDGTLLDTLADLTDAVNVTMRIWNKPEVDSDTVRRSLGHGAGHLLACAAGVEDDDDIVKDMKEFYIPYYAEHSDIKTEPYPGIIDLLKNLQANGIKCAVISNKPDRATKLLAEKKFSGMLSLAVGESETVKAKPDPAGVLFAMKECGGIPEETLYVGDSEVDIITAKNAGMTSIGVAWGFRDAETLKAQDSDHIVYRADEIFDIANG